MTSPDRSEEVLGALKAYFSGPIAKALLTSTLRRAGLEGRSLDEGALPQVEALEDQDTQHSGWYAERCVYFDALEADDLFIYPQDERKEDVHG